MSRTIPKFQRPSRQPAAAAATSAQPEMRVSVNTIMAKVGSLQLENDELGRQNQLLREQLKQALEQLGTAQGEPQRKSRAGKHR